MDEHKFTSNKTTLADVWIGTQQQLEDIKRLVNPNSRMMVYASHFMKFFSLSNRYFEYSEMDCAAILSLLNNPASNFHGTERFRASMHDFMLFVQYRGESIRYFQNFAIYHGKMLEAQYLTNPQEHFIQKLKGYCTHMIVQTYKNQVPIGIDRDQHLSNLRARARNVQNYCLLSNQFQVYSRMNQYDQGIVDTLLNILPNNIHTNGLPYDVVARAIKYAEPYYRLGLLYEAQGMKLFNVFPLCTSTIPRHMTMDTLLLCKHVLRIPGSVSELQIGALKYHYWSRVVDLNNKAFKRRNGMFFKGIHI